MSTPVLWQFRASHYNEKARWALDWKGIPHVRRTLLPGWHMPRVAALTWQTQVPVLVLDGGEVIADSTNIIARLEALRPDPPLYPTDEAERRRALELEEFFDEQLGPHIRRAFFFDALDHPDYMVSLFASGEPAITRSLYRTFFPVGRLVMRIAMGIDAPRAERSRQTMEEALDRLEAEIGPSGYLVGDRFTVADLTAASLLAPLLMPQEFPYPFPKPPDSVARLRAAYTSRPAFTWGAGMYRRHRGDSAAVEA
jgi:glutathione S-transferase